MKLLLIGYGKTGSLVGDIARERGHEVRVVVEEDNASGVGLAPDRLNDIDVAIDFTGPHAVLGNIYACIGAGKNMVVGTTGWYGELERIRQLVENRGTGLVYAANFSVGVNLFFDVARAAAAALRHEYSGQIFERHHAHKEDAPSGTALAIQHVIQEASGKSENLEITSFREGDVVGMHEVVLDSPADKIYLCHDAKSRQGFADGAVRAAEWIPGKKGFYDFKDMWREM